MQGIGSGLVAGEVCIGQLPPGGCGAQQWAEIVLGRILSISEQTCGVARMQAEAFRGALRQQLTQAFDDALSQQRAGLAWRLEQAGMAEAAAAVRAL